MRVEFLKNGVYRGKSYLKGAITEMSQIDTKVYIDCKVVEIFKPKRKEPNIEELGYNGLRALCKEKGIPAMGSKEELIAALKEIMSLVNKNI